MTFPWSSTKISSREREREREKESKREVKHSDIMFLTAVVSCPAMSMVIKSSRSTLLVRSSPLMSARNLNRLGSSPTSLSSNSSTLASLLVSTARFISFVSIVSSMSMSFRNSTCPPIHLSAYGRFQYGMNDELRCSASRNTRYTALTIGDSFVTLPKS